jgi:hypothetical protein
MSSNARQLLCLASTVVALCVSNAQAQSQRPPAIADLFLHFRQNCRV